MSEVNGIMRLIILFLAMWQTNSVLAVSLAPEGRGEVLYYPFYTVTEGFQSLISIENNSEQAKALKLTIREAHNQREAVTFNLYLGPLDTWVAALFLDEEFGRAGLLTRDESCTVPDIIGQTALAPFLPRTSNDDRYVDLRNFSYTRDGFPQLEWSQDEGVDDLSRTFTGSIEVIEMGVLDDAQMGSATAATDTLGVPNDCQQLNLAWQVDEFGEPIEGAYWSMDPATDLLPPAGKLSGSMTLIDVLDAVQINYRAIALSQFSSSQLHGNPGDSLPNLTSVNVDADANGFVDSIIQDPETGQAILSNWDRPIDAVSALFMTETLSFDYSIESSLNAESELVLSFPTKRYYTDELLVGAEPMAPFSDLFRIEDDFRYGASVEYRPVFVNREAEIMGSFCSGFVCDQNPQPPPGPIVLTVSAAVNVLLMADADASPGIFGRDENTRRTIPAFFSNGAYTLELTHPIADGERHRLTDREGRDYRGLPVTGFSVQVIRNDVSFNSGVVGNYMGLFPHKFRQRIEQPGTADD